MPLDPTQQSAEFDALEPVPAPTLKPRKWHGIIALLCGAYPAIAFILFCGFFLMPFVEFLPNHIIGTVSVNFPGLLFS